MRTRENDLQFIAVMMDLLIINLSFLLCTILFHHIFIESVHFFLAVLLANFSWILAYMFIKTSTLYSQKGFKIRLKRILSRSAIFLILSAVNFYIFRSQIGYLFVFIFSASFLFIFLKLSLNYIYYRVVKYYHLRNVRIRSALLVGRSPIMQEVEQIIKYNPILNFLFVGYVDEEDDKDVLGNSDDLEKLIKEYNIQVVFVSIKNADELKTSNVTNRDLLQTCNRMGVRLFYIPEENNVDRDLYDVEYLNDIPIINPQLIPLDSMENRIKKRIFDLAFSSFVIVFIMSWLYPILVLVIKLSSKGPVLFVQKRTGINKVTFDCYKFRSMHINKEADLMQATEGDARITKIGNFMRKSSLDELPQFFNVFKGNMSVVGPRPHMLAHTNQYSALIDDYLVRHYVKPGITGWAQINGLRGEIDKLWKMEERVNKDIEYVNNWSLDWDIIIIWKTVFDNKSAQNAR